MSASRLRRGEQLVLLGLVGLLGSLVLQWVAPGTYSTRTGDHTDTVLVGRAAGDEVLIGVSRGWGTLGHPWLEFLALFGLALLVVLWTAARSGPGRSTYAAVVSLSVSITVGAVVLLLTLLRALVFRPGVHLDLRGGGTITIHPSVAVGTWVGLAGLVVALVGLWVAMADDRTDAEESAIDAPAPRPVPPVRTL